MTHSSIRRSPVNRQDRAAFTLLETILALTLTSLLVVGLVSATSLYAQYRTRSIEGIRETLVFQGTVEDLRDDLRSCFESVVTPQRKPQIRPGGGSLLQRSSVIAEQVLELESEQPEQLVQFVGRPDAILLVRKGVNRRFSPAEPVTGDHRQIIWLGPQQQSVRFPISFHGSRVSYREVRVPPSQLGLTRRSTSLPTAGSVATRNANRGVNASWHSNAEVEQISFRYFDGSDWVSRWDSHLLDRQIPIAVEITVSFVGSPERSSRVIVRLPGATP